MSQNNLGAKRNIVRMIGTMFVLLSISSTLIYFGSRGDAATVAQKIKSGVLTSDEVNIAFENVGGKLLSRKVQESQHVKKGDVLLVLDDKDTLIAIDKLKAQIEAQKASLDQQIESIKIEDKEINLKEITLWRQIEQLQAALKSASSSEGLAALEYGRSAKLITSKSISKSAYDSNQSTLVKAKASKVQAQRQLDSATYGATVEQLETLKATGSAEGMTLSEIENARLNLKNQNNTVRAMQAQLAQLEAELEQLKLNHQRLTLLAPEDGKILKILYQEGEMIGQNAPAVILETDRKYFDIYVNEQQVLNYKENTRIKAHVIADDSYVDGTVRFATAAPSFSDLRMTREHGQADLTMFKVRIYLDARSKCLTGMTLEVEND